MAIARSPTTPQIMGLVLLALSPGVAAMTWVWGWGVLFNVVVLATLCVLIEGVTATKFAFTSAHAWARARSAVCDGSALVTAVLIAICLPPYTPVWPLCVAALAAIGLAKHAYGGLGRNLFNPAMVGFAFVLVAFPAELSLWPSVSETTDGLTGATLLTDFRYRDGMTTAEFTAGHSAAMSANRLIALAFLVGGVALLVLRLIAWRIPVAITIGIAVAALFGHDQGSSQSLGSVWFHVQVGGMMAAALFVATAPVTHPSDPRDQWLFGILIGVLAYSIRGLGSYPDGIAFAILLANCVTPLLESRRLHTTLPAPDEPGQVTLEDRAADAPETRIEIRPQ